MEFFSTITILLLDFCLRPFEVNFAAGNAVLDISLPALKQCARVGLSFSSYHSWFFSQTPVFHGNIMVYW